MELVASLRENIIADAFAQGRIRDGLLAERLIRERLNAADEIERLRKELQRYDGDICPFCYRAKELPQKAADF